MLPSRSTWLRLGAGSLGCLLQPALAAEAAAKFPVLEYRVLGNTVLAERDIERVLYPRLGEGQSIEDVEQARLALEEQYHAAGYGTVFVDIPEQQIEDGVVRLKITEGRIARLRVTGARYFSGRILKGALPAGAEGTVPHLPVLQDQLTTLNGETPDRVITPILKPGADPGTLQLTLDVKDHLPLHASLGLNNQYSADTSQLRGIATLAYDDFFGRLDSLSLTYQFSPQDAKQVQVWAASYTARLPGKRGMLVASFIDSDSDVATAGDGGSDISVLGKGKVYGLRWVGPAYSTLESFHQVNAGIDYKDYTESVISSDLLLTPISYVNFSVGQNSAWRSPSRQWGLGASANFGVRGVGNESEEFAVKRYRGVPNYFLIRSDASVAQHLPRDASLRLRISGQYAVDSIITNEQFSIAGASATRGYFEAEQLGDVGARGSLEIAAPHAILLGGRLQLDGFAFYDAGWMKRNNPLREQDPFTHEPGDYLERRHVTLHSTGIGMNLSLQPGIDGSLTWARALADSGVDGGTEEGDNRVLFSLRVHW